MSDTYAMAYEIESSGDTGSVLAVGVLVRPGLVVLRPEPGTGDAGFPRLLRQRTDAWLAAQRDSSQGSSGVFRVRLGLGTRDERLETYDAPLYFGAAKNSRWSAFVYLPVASQLPISARFSQGAVTARQLRDLATTEGGVTRSELHWDVPPRPTEFRIGDPTTGSGLEVEFDEGRVVVTAAFNPCRLIGCPHFCPC